MNTDIAIKVENISKKYIIGEKNNFITLRDKIVNLPKALFSRNKPKSFWALKDISFDVIKGEILGVIGSNGAGKSTLLKILSRITEPTSGKVIMKGRVASLLEVGTGFNPELTGRENIYLNGSIIGMSKKEIQTKFDNIIKFSGIGKFLDTPVKRYSSGMYVRLAFAVAAHLDCDILLIDEVLAVGDNEFQKKCLGKINELASDGRTVVLVSHNMTSIQNLCTKTIWLSDGVLKSYASTKITIRKYLLFNSKSPDGNHVLNLVGPLKTKIKYKKFSINGHIDKPPMILPKDKIEFDINGESLEIQPNFMNTIVIYRDGVKVATLQDVIPATTLGKGSFAVKFTIPPYILRPGEYTLNLLGLNESHQDWIFAEDVAAFSIIPEWSENYLEINDGIVNIPFQSSRNKLNTN